ncbi:MAG: SDR family oxidoreductase [Bacteroidota bacterium]
MAIFFITGATGSVGKQVVQSLLENGHQVKAGNRHPGRSQEQFGNSVEAVHFDFENASTFQEADGADGVFLLGPSAYPDLYTLLSPFADYLIENKSNRVVYLSAYGMDDLPELPFHQQMEDKLKQTALDWRIVQPGFFMQNFKNYEGENIEQRKIIFSPAGEGKTGFISTHDIGKVVAILLTADEYQHQTYVLTGEQTYTHFEVADMLSEIRGEKVEYANPDQATYRSALSQAGAPDFLADYMLLIYGLIKNGKVEETTHNVEKLTGQKPETLRAALERDFTTG